MTGSKAGAAKARITRLERYGVDADGKSIQHKQAGSKGGSAIHDNPRGFGAMSKAKRVKVATKGGTIGRKKSKK